MIIVGLLFPISFIPWKRKREIERKGHKDSKERKKNNAKCWPYFITILVLFQFSIPPHFYRYLFELQEFISLVET